MNKLMTMIMKRKRRLLVCAPEFCGIELLSKPVPDVPSPPHTGLGPSYPKPGSEERREQPIENQRANKSKRVKLDRTADDGAQRLENEATVQPPPPSKPTDPVASTRPPPLEYVALCPQQWAARTALAMAQLTDAVRALLGHSHTTPDTVGIDLLGSPASHSTRAAESMGMGIPVGGGFLGSSNSSGESSCGVGFGWLGGVQGLHRGGSMGNSSGFGGGFDSGFGSSSSSSGGCVRGVPWGNGLFSPWQGCSIQGHAQGHACHVPLCSSSRLRMINGIAPVPHTPPPPLPPSSEPTPSLRRHEVLPPWASASATTAAPAPSPSHAAVDSRPLTAGTLHPVLGAASNHAVGFLPEWRGVDASVVAGMKRVRVLQRQQRDAAHGSGHWQPQQKHGLGKGMHKTLKKKKAKTAAPGDASRGGGVCARGVGVGGRGEEVEEEMRQRDAEDGQWWHNLRFTLCMLRRGLCKDELARGALVVYIIAPSPEPYDAHRCCMEAAACLTPPSGVEQPVHAPLDAATNLPATQPLLDAPANPSATQPLSDKPTNPFATQPLADAPTSLPAANPQADVSKNPSATQSASSEPAKGLPSAAGPSFHPASQPSPPQSVPPPPSPGTQTAPAAAAAAAAWRGLSLGVETGSALGPSFHLSGTSLPAAGMLVQVLLPFVLHDPTSSSIRAAALSICNTHLGLQAHDGAHHMMN